MSSPAYPDSMFDDLDEAELAGFEFANSALVSLMGDDPYARNIARLVAEVRRRRAKEAEEKSRYEDIIANSDSEVEMDRHCHGEFCGCTCPCGGCRSERT